MAKARTKSPAASGNAKPRRTSRQLARLSIAVGDPLQPAGLSEYLAVQKAGGAKKGLATDTARQARAAALKSAHARWKGRTERSK